MNDTPGTAHVEPRQRHAERVEVEERIAGQHVVAMRQQPAVDLVLLDVSLPNMSGLEAIRVLRSLPEYADIPIVAMTGHTSPEQHAQYLEAGFTEHLGKPFMPDELTELVGNLLSSAGGA